MKTASFIKIKIATLSAVCLSLLFLNSCKKENLCDCFKTTGKESSITRTLDPFDKVLVKDKVDVYLEEDSVFSVRIEGGKNVIKLIKTEVDHGTLVIHNDNRCNFVRSYKRELKVIVKTPRYREITHNGVGNIYCVRPLKSDSLTYHVFNSGDLYLDVDNTRLIGGNNGMGDVIASGKTNYHLVYCHGEGWVNAKNLQTQTSDLVLLTSGLTYVNASNALIVLIERTGDVYYNGDPAVIDLKKKGPGQLIKGF